MQGTNAAYAAYAEGKSSAGNAPKAQSDKAAAAALGQRQGGGGGNGGKSKKVTKKRLPLLGEADNAWAKPARRPPALQPSVQP